MKATGDEGDANYAKELEKHDTREGVTYRRVFIPNYKNELIASISFFDFYDVNYKTVQFITLNQWFNKNLLLEPSLENIIFPSINLNAFEKLNKKYKKVYGNNIENIEIKHELVCILIHNDTNTIEHKVHNISPLTTLLNSKALKFHA